MEKKNLFLLLCQMGVMFLLVLFSVPLKAFEKEQVNLDQNASVLQEASFSNTLTGGNFVFGNFDSQISVVENEIVVSVKTATGSRFIKLTSLHRIIQNQIGFYYLVPQDDRPAVQCTLLYTAALRI